VFASWPKFVTKIREAVAVDVARGDAHARALPPRRRSRRPRRASLRKCPAVVEKRVRAVVPRRRCRSRVAA
jgi:hypothetical protein